MNFVYVLVAVLYMIDFVLLMFQFEKKCYVIGFSDWNIWKDNVLVHLKQDVYTIRDARKYE